MEIHTGEVRRTAAITFSLAADEAAVIIGALASSLDDTRKSRGAGEIRLIQEVRKGFEELRLKLDKDDPRPKAASPDR